MSWDERDDDVEGGTSVGCRVDLPVDLVPPEGRRTIGEVWGWDVASVWCTRRRHPDGEVHWCSALDEEPPHAHLLSLAWGGE